MPIQTLHDELKDHLAARRGQMRMRVGLAGGISLAFGSIAGWAVCLGWFGLYAAVQASESRWLGRSRSNTLILAALALNSIVFGVFALIAPMKDGVWGLVGGICMLCGAMLNTALASQKSIAAFLALLLPLAVMLASTPFIALGLGALPRQALIIGISAGFICAAVVMIFRSATKAMTAERDARARAEAADAAKSAFVAMVSHELRTPISAMLAGATEAASASTAGERRANLNLISDSARMMRMLLNDLLDLQKIEAGKMGVEEIAFDLRGLVEDAVRFWRPEARKQGLEFRLEGADDLPRTVAGDPNRIRQILNNLFSNALKFTDRGEVSLVVDASPSANGWSVTMTVSDTGAGMDEDQAQRLFQPFVQAEAKVARTHGGTGLGLSISRELARLMGGDITLATERGTGSSFSVRLTLKEAAAVAPEADAVGVRPGLRILVADDHPMNRRAFELMLAPLEAKVTLAVDGVEAVSAAQSDEFDLIFLDLNMPRMGGLEAARAIRAFRKDVPILALTASVSEADKRACTDAGMSGFVGKPTEAAELYQAIDAALAPAVEIASRAVA